MSALRGITDKVSQISGLERKFTSMIKNPLNILAPQKFGFLSNSWLTKMRGRSDPVLTIDWDVQLPRVVTKNLGSEYVERISVVFPYFDVREVYAEGKLKKYPGATKHLDNLVLTFYADINNKSFEYINMWINSVGKNGFYGRPAPFPGITGRFDGYKKPITVWVKDPYQEDLIRIDYKNCWPISIDSVDLVGDESARAVWQVTFSVEDIELSGYNLDTITGSIMDLVSGTANALTSAVSDIAKGVGNNLANSAKEWASNNGVISGLSNKVSSFF